MARTRTVLITGANRGLGYGMTQQFLNAGLSVIATARHADGARDLWELEHAYGARCRVLTLDVTSDSDLRKAAAALAGQPLDILVNNAGVLAEADQDFAKVTADALLKSFTVNTVGPLRVTQALLPNLTAAADPIVATLTSKMGSITDNTSGGAYAYRISKAAVNMFNKSFALDHKGVTAVVLHPGWVQTDMGGAGAPLSVEASVAGLVKIILGLKRKDSGKFYDYSGEELPW